jgi:diguanylate cyclase (GGDEF)-like protein
VAPAADFVSADPELLPLLETEPDRLASLRLGEGLMLPANGQQAARTYIPIHATHEHSSVLELHTDTELDLDALRLVGAVLRVYRNFHDLLDYSERDTLTGMLNRKTFDDCFMRRALEVRSEEGSDERAGRNPQDRRNTRASTVWLAVVDIDHFKRVNDVHGHLIGDEVLLLLGRLMRRSFRYYDDLFRLGGEEFAVLMRCEQASDCHKVLERLRENVAGFEFPRVGRITISLGVSQVRAGDTPAWCFERADKALYQAKQQGRNKLCNFDDLVNAGSLLEPSRVSDIELF